MTVRLPIEPSLLRSASHGRRRRRRCRRLGRCGEEEDLLKEISEFVSKVLRRETIEKEIDGVRRELNAAQARLHHVTVPT